MKVIYKKTVDRDELISALNELSIRKSELDDHFEVLEDLFGFVADSTLYDAVYKTFDKYCDMLAMAFGIQVEDLSWFIFENELGCKSDAFLLNGKTYVVDSVTSFVDYLIAKSKT